MAQSTAGTNLAVTAITHAKTAWKVEVAWGKKWGDTIVAEDWIDESAKAIEITITHDLVDPNTGLTLMGHGIGSQASVILDNPAHRYTPWNTSSPIYDDIKDGKLYMTPIRLELGYYDGATAETIRVFGGVIDLPNTQVFGPQVEFTCLDRSATFREQRESTTLYTNQWGDQWLVVLATLAGIEAGDRNFDHGLFLIPYAWLEEESLWDEMQTLAVAEGGYVYFDEYAVLQFENMAHWVLGTDHTTVQFTITNANCKRITPKFISKEVYSGVIVELNSREEWAPTIVCSRDDALVLEPGVTKTITTRFDYPCTELYDPEYIAMTRTNRRSTDLSISGTEYAQHADWEITNEDTNYTLFLLNFDVLGLPIVGGPKDDIRWDSPSPGISEEKVYELRDNLHIQLRSHGECMAEFLGERIDNPRTVYEVSDAPAIPWLQRGDRLALQHTGSGIDTEANIMSISFRWSQEALLMNMTLLDSADLFPHSNYFIIGTDGLGPSSKPLFY